MRKLSRALAGDLANAPLRELVPRLIYGHANGRLTLERGAIRRSFELVDAAVVSCASSAPREHLGQLLVELGWLSPDQAAAAFSDQESTRILLGQLLPLRGMLDEKQARTALETKIAESFCDCYTWTGGQYRFEYGLPRMARALRVSVPLQRLLPLAEQRRCESIYVLHMLPHPSARLLMADVGTGPRLSPEEVAVVEVARSGSSVADALALLRGPSVAAQLKLLSLVERGHLRVDRSETPDEEPEGALVRRARELQARGDLLGAYGLLEKASQVGASAELQRLLREVEAGLGVELWEQLLRTHRRAKVSRSEPELRAMDLSVDERYLLRRLENDGDLRAVVRKAPMGELCALRMVRKLVDAKVVELI